MGIYDRDWHKAERFQQRQEERLRGQENTKWYQAKLFRGRARSRAPSSSAPDVNPIGALFQSFIYCFAVFGAVTLLVRVIKWFSG